MNHNLQRLAQAKTVADHGFSRVGPQLRQDDQVARALMLLACRCVSVANAIMVLARGNHANEALPLLRSFLEMVVHMRWIVAGDREPRALEFIREHDRPQWDGVWSGRRLAERCSALNFPEEPRAKILRWCHEHLWGNSAGLPWAHVFSPEPLPGAAAEDVLEAAAALLEEAVAALDRHWPGQFSVQRSDHQER